MDIASLLARRARNLDASGIRRIFELGASLKDPINLSIGQPDFPVPDSIKAAAIEAIQSDRNGYTLTQGIAELRAEIESTVSAELGWSFGAETSALVTSGTSGALTLAFLALLEEGDEVILPDPYFLVYPSMAKLCGATPVLCDTYPDFRMTAERVEALMTPRTKIVLYNSPSNPSGVVGTEQDCRDLLELCRSRGVLLISDEIYDAFTYSEARTQATAAGQTMCPSPARFAGAQDDVLLVRGFGKTYGCTGWRLGYAAGPTALMTQMAKLQQYTYVCAPSAFQHAGIAALRADIQPLIDAYETRRDMVVERLSQVTELAVPGGAFYAFPKVPERLGLTGSQFVERCIEQSLLVIPGGVFSSRDTHFRLSFAAPPAKVEAGLDVLCDLMRA